jgi:hypothetical protein
VADLSRRRRRISSAIHSTFLERTTPGRAAETAVFSSVNNWGNRRLRLSVKGMADSNLLTSLFADEVSIQTRCTS